MEKMKRMKGKKFDVVLIKYIEENNPKQIPLSILADLMEQTRGSKYKKEYREWYVHTMISRISKRNKWYELYYNRKEKVFTYEKKDSYVNFPLVEVEIEEDLDSLPVEYYPTGKHSKRITKTTTTTETTVTTETVVEETIEVKEKKTPNVIIDINCDNGVFYLSMKTPNREKFSELDEIIFPEMDNLVERKLLEKIKSILSVKVDNSIVYYKIIDVNKVVNVQWLYDILYKTSGKIPYILYGDIGYIYGLTKSLTNNGKNPLSMNGFCNGIYNPSTDDITSIMLHARSRWINCAVNDYVKSLSLGLNQKNEPDIDEIKKEAKEEAKKELIDLINKF